MSAPIGNTNAAKENREWGEALRRSIKQYECKERKISRGDYLNRLAEKILADAYDGDQFSRKEITERMDGKVAQQIDAKVDASVNITISQSDAEL